MHSLKAGSQYDARAHVSLHCAHVGTRLSTIKCKDRLISHPCVSFHYFTLTTMQQNTRIDSDPILAFLYVAFLRLVMKDCEFMNIFALPGAHNERKGRGRSAKCLHT